MKSSSPYSPMILTYLSETIDNPKRILYIFKNNFCTIDGKTQEKKKQSHKNYSGYLTNENANTFFFTPTDKE